MVITRDSHTRVTLALDIIGKITRGPRRGYHELGTIKQLIDLSDTVTIEDAPHDELLCDDPRVPCDQNNLCLRVVQLVRGKKGINRSVRISLEKRIPVMGGLAGGSTNAATTLLLLDELWELKLSMEEKIELGREIGMDVPFYFVGSTAFDSEAGGRLEPLTTGLSLVFVLALPDFGVSTREAYGGLDYAATGRNVTLTDSMRIALFEGDRQAVLSAMHNDFEVSVFTHHPVLGEIKGKMLDAGCEQAMMTGSGSTVIGVARDVAHAEKIAAKMDCQTIISRTLL